MGVDAMVLIFGADIVRGIELFAGRGIDEHWRAPVEIRLGRRFLTKLQVEKFLESFDESRMFSVTFEKRDGTLRRMVCRRHVTKHLKGLECDKCDGVGSTQNETPCPVCKGEGRVPAAATYNGKDDDRDNIGVFDLEAGGYRCFNGARVVSIRGGGAEISSGQDLSEEQVVNARGVEVKKD